MKTGVRYDVRYRVNGRQCEKSFKRKVDAVKFGATVEVDIARGDWIDDRQSKQTVAELAERWFATLGGHRASTPSRYRAILDRHVLPAFGRLPIGRLDHHSVAVWISDQSDQGLSAASISKHRNVLSQICGSAIRAGVIRANPVDGIRIAKSPTRTRRFLTPVEVEALATEITNPPPHVSRPYDTPRDELGLLIRFLAFTGLRIGEAFGLQVGDLDFNPGRVEVQLTASETSGVVNIPSRPAFAAFHYRARWLTTFACCVACEAVTSSSGQTAPAGPAAKATSAPGTSCPPPAARTSLA